MSYSKDWEEFLRGKPVDPNKLEPVPDTPSVTSVPEDGFGNPWESDDGEQPPFPGMGPVPILIIAGPPQLFEGPVNPGQFPDMQQVVIRRSLAEKDFSEFLECVSGGDVPGYPLAPGKRPWGTWIIGGLVVVIASAITLALWLSGKS